MITTEVTFYNEKTRMIEPTEQAVVEYEIYRAVLRFAELAGYHDAKQVVFEALEQAKAKFGRDL